MDKDFLDDCAEALQMALDKLGIEAEEAAAKNLFLSKNKFPVLEKFFDKPIWQFSIVVKDKSGRKAVLPFFLFSEDCPLPVDMLGRGTAKQVKRALEQWRISQS